MFSHMGAAEAVSRDSVRTMLNCYLFTYSSDAITALRSFTNSCRKYFWLLGCKIVRFLFLTLCLLESRQHCMLCLLYLKTARWERNVETEQRQPGRKKNLIWGVSLNWDQMGTTCVFNTNNKFFPFSFLFFKKEDVISPLMSLSIQSVFLRKLLMRNKKQNKKQKVKGSKFHGYLSPKL